MGTDERSDMKDAVQMSREESSFGKKYMGGKGWLLFGIFIVVILGAIAISIFLQYEGIEIRAQDATLMARVLRFSPVLAVISYTCAVIALVLLYGIHCRFVRGIAYEDRKRAKDREDFISQLSKESKRVVPLPLSQAQQVLKILKVEIDVRYHENDSRGSEEVSSANAASNDSANA